MVDEDAQRWARVAKLRSALETSTPGSSTQLAGSLASGTFDAFSDIDLTWQVGPMAGAVLDRIEQILNQVDPVASLRVDPDTQALPDRRLLFVRFSGWPLFWRVDLDVRGDFSAVDAARAWSDAESALMNAVGALKALYRGQRDLAADLLSRGFVRIGAVEPGGPPSRRIMALTRFVEAQAPHLSDIAAQISETVRTREL